MTGDKMGHYNHESQETADDAEWTRREQLSGLLLACRARRARPQLPGIRAVHLRQEDAADLAQVSLRTYWAFERGEGSPSAELTDRIAGALRMHDAERSALHVLARRQDPPRPVTSPGSAPPGDQLDTALRLLASQLDPYPAALADETWTVLHANQAMAEWPGGQFGPGAAGCGHLICCLFTEHSARFLPDIATLRRQYTAALRYQLARNTGSPGWRDVIDCLTSRPGASELWDLHEVGFAPRNQACRLAGPDGQEMAAQMFLIPVSPDRWLWSLVLPPGARPPRTKPAARVRA
jgi:transcriptional regulator with XRE-family HTH domain